MLTAEAIGLHDESIVIDGVCPLVMDDVSYIDWYRDGGVTVLAPTMATIEDARATMNRIAAWHRLFRERTDLALVRTSQDIRDLKGSGRTGVYLHLQGTNAIEDNLDLVDLYKALGVGVIQLAYNVRNRVGDGCEERNDAGLSRFGIALIERMNTARVIVDCSHTGLRTSLDAIECSTAPVVLSHSNAKSVHANARNVVDELIIAIAESEGLVGAVGFPSMVGKTSKPSLDEFIDHIDAIAKLVGVDHVGLGLDYYPGQAGVATDEAAMNGYREARQLGLWGAAYPPPPHHYPAGIDTPRTLRNLTSRLLQRGYVATDVQKILGGNWLRVMQRVWG